MLTFNQNQRGWVDVYVSGLDTPIGELVTVAGPIGRTWRFSLDMPNLLLNEEILVELAAKIKDLES